MQVLSHESYHLSGILSEAQTECSAIQRLDEVAGWLGASPDEARALAERYYNEIYPRMPSAYRSIECVDGASGTSHPTTPPGRRPLNAGKRRRRSCPDQHARRPRRRPRRP